MGNGLLDDNNYNNEITTLSSYQNNNNDLSTITKETLELNILLKIIEQMKTCICKIEKENSSGTGFFCLIPYSNKSIKLPVLITSNTILGKDDIMEGKSIKLLFYDKSYKIIKIDKYRKVYTSNEEKDNITIIEIKNGDKININKILNIDNGIYNEKYLTFIYKNKSIYSIYYSNNTETKYDISIITNINSENNKFVHLCGIEIGSLGAPILNFENYGVIGINIGNNLGTLLKGPINEFKQLNKLQEKSIFNEIILKVEISKDEVGKVIYFLDNTNFKDYETNKYHFHDNLKELNKDNTKLFINDQEFLFSKCFKPSREGIYNINLVFNIQVTDCSYMFYYCYNIININFSLFNSSSVTNMSKMFGLCLNLTRLDLSSLDTSKVTDMSNMFYFCQNLKEVNLYSFNTKNVINMYRMFSDCIELESLNLTNFNTKNVKSMSHMFFLCKNLSQLDLSYFNTSNVITMSNMFYFCRSLMKLDLSTFNTEKVFDMSKMFYLCQNLKKINLSSFNTKNVINMSYMFSYCKNLLTIDLSSFNTTNVIDMSHFLSGCDFDNINLSNFNTINVTNMNCMFYFCKNLKNVNVTSFNTKNVKNMSYMFADCRLLRQLDLSSFDIKSIKEMNSMFAGCVKSLKIKVNKDSIEKFKKENELNIFYE